MIGHDDEPMQNIFLVLVIVGEHIKPQMGDAFVWKQRRSLPRYGGNEESPVKGHRGKI
jgi:hypothetical protein